MRFPALQKAEDTFHAFSYSGRVLFLFFAGVCVVSAVALLYILNASLLVSVPAYGGSLSEGIIGAPRFINPILATSDSDQDLTALVYSGLLKATPDGQYVPDLAASYTISPDGLTYTFSLRKNATFQDGTPVTADDVVFTVQKAQDPALKSPLEANWSGVTVSETDPQTVVFTLKNQYAPFIENLTLGILPKHLWQNVSDDEFSFSELNTSPIGSGPFMVGSISRSDSGLPSSYDLTPFNNYILGQPYLSDLMLKFYDSESDLVAALKSGDIEAANSLSPTSLGELEGYRVDVAPLNRVFAVFFNQNQSTVLRDLAVRQALNDAIDRKALVNDVLGGYGTPLTGPLPPNAGGSESIITAPPATTSTVIATSTATSSDPALIARAELIKAGWVLGGNGVLTKTTGKGKSAVTETLSFSLATDNVPELVAAANYLKKEWGEMGASVDVQIYDQGDLSQNVIRPRKYDALLFGEVVGREADLFAFWDSSQRNDPGLNVALYANASADKILEQLRTTSDASQRASLYNQFTALLQADMPAVFLYAPDFVYIVPQDLGGLNLGFIETPSDRYLSVASWFRQTDSVWPIFAKNN